MIKGIRRTLGRKISLKRVGKSSKMHGTWTKLKKEDHSEKLEFETQENTMPTKPHDMWVAKSCAKNWMEQNSVHTR